LASNESPTLIDAYVPGAGAGAGAGTGDGVDDGDDEGEDEGEEEEEEEDDDGEEDGDEAEPAFFSSDPSPNAPTAAKLNHACESGELTTQPPDLPSPHLQLPPSSTGKFSGSINFKSCALPSPRMISILLLVRSSNQGLMMAQAILKIMGALMINI